MKWIAIAAAVIIITALIMFRFWRYQDDRAMYSTWNHLTATAVHRPELFDLRQLDGLPDPARRFFNHAIKKGTPLYTVAEISMHGEFSLGDKNEPKYQPMSACQLLAPPFGFIWHVKAGAGLIQFSGSDAAFPDGSWTRFWLLGLLPVARVGGTNDHAVSSFGRYMAEAIFWSPASLLPTDNVVWTEVDNNTARVTVTHSKFKQAFDITVDNKGRIEQVQFDRWTDANEDKAYRFQPFGGYLSDYQEFDGYILPTTVVAGNHYGTEKYFPFFKATVDQVSFIKDRNTERTCTIGGKFKAPK